MNETIRTAGECGPTPTTATMNPSVAARLYAGAVEATEMTRFEMYPIASVLSPLAPGAVGSAAGSGGLTTLESTATNTFPVGLPGGS